MTENQFIRMCSSSSECTLCTMYDFWATQCPIEKPSVQSVCRRGWTTTYLILDSRVSCSFEHESCNHPLSLALSMLLLHPVFLYSIFFPTMTSGILINKRLWSFLKKAQSLLNLPSIYRFPVTLWSRPCSVVSEPFYLTCILRLSIVWV